MKHIKKICMVLAVMLFCIVALFTGSQADDYQAASSYTNAKLFYESTYAKDDINDDAHAEAVNGSFYFATCSKKAASSTNLRYQTLGFDVSLSANGYTVSFAVKRGDSMPELIEAGVDDGTYVYNLYCIETEALYELGSTVNASAMEKIKKADKIRVKVDAIMTLKKGNTLYGSIEEDGKGGITESGSRYVYHLKEEAER